MRLHSVDPKLKADPVQLVAVLTGPADPANSEPLSEEDALTLLWSLAVNTAQRTPMLAAGTIPALLPMLNGSKSTGARRLPDCSWQHHRTRIAQHHTCIADCSRQ